MNRHLEWIDKKAAELEKEDEIVHILLEVDTKLKELEKDQVVDIVIYLLGRLHRATNKLDFE